MARPIKKGLDYFPVDTKIFSDPKIKGLIRRYGTDGFTVFMYILCTVYDDEGYYHKHIDELIEDISFTLNMSIEKIGQIINFLCKRSLLDGKLFTSDKVITSHGIQKRFQEAVKSRGRKNCVSVFGKFWLLQEDEMQEHIKVTHFESYSGKNPDYSEKNYSYSREKSTKESKENKSKGNKIKAEESSNAPAADKVIHKYEQMIGFVTPAVMEGIDFIIGEGMEPELVSRIIEYACEQGKRSWQYINAALLGNLKENILTLDAYNRHQAERTECKAFQQKTPEKKAKRSKFNNYNDSNKKDYSKIQEDILKELLEE